MDSPFQLKAKNPESSLFPRSDGVTVPQLGHSLCLPDAHGICGPGHLKSPIETVRVTLPHVSVRHQRVLWAVVEDSVCFPVLEMEADMAYVSPH